MTNISPQISKLNIWLYGSLSLGTAIVAYPIGVWIPRLYATDIGLPLAMIGMVIFLAAVFDAFSDPIIGFASDKFQTRFGQRKPWIAVGVPLYSLALWFLLNPSPEATVVYLAVCFILLRVGSTMILVPYSAWGAELSPEYHTRTKIQSVREKFVIAGLLSASLIVLYVENAEAPSRPSASIILPHFNWAILGLMPLLALLVISSVPKVPTLELKKNLNLRNSLKFIGKNGIFRRLIIIEFLVFGGESFRNAVALFFMQDYIGADRVGWLYIIFFSVGFLTIPLWDFLAEKYGKHRALAASMILIIFVNLATFSLKYGDTTAYYFLFALKGVAFGAFTYLPRAMLADVVDIDTARSGNSRPGSYFAIFGLATKCAASIGGLSLPLLALANYSTTQNVANSPDQLLWLGVIYAILPSIMFAFAFYFTFTWPLSAKRHARIQSRLEKRTERIRRLKNQ